jgi:hypothetical protein
MTNTKVSSFLTKWGFNKTSEDEDWDYYRINREGVKIRIKLDKIERNLILHVLKEDHPFFVASFTSDDSDMLIDSISFFTLLNYDK